MEPNDCGDAVSALALADALAADLLARLAPFRFDIARVAAECETAYRLRYRAVVERGWGTPDEFPDGVESDAYDADAVHVLGWDGEAPIATARLVRPAPGRPLPTEVAFDLTVEPAGQVVDVGRVTIAREYSDGEHRVLAGLLARTWLEVRAGGFTRACGAFAAPSSIRLYRRMGFQMTFLAPPRWYWGEVRYPLRWEVAEAAPTLAARWSALDAP